MIWGHYQRATNNTMELRAVRKALKGMPEGMVVLASTDSNYLNQGIENRIHKSKGNGWKNARKGQATNDTLWHHELDDCAPGKD
jgi:ribonuclease HI